MRVSGRSGVLRTLRHLSALSFIASVGCGSARAPSNEQGGTSGSSSAGTGGARAETGGTANGGQPELVVPDENAGSANATRCTSDLRSVVNDSGVAVKECPPDQGCANGVCLAACDAAAKSRGSVGCEFFALDPPSEWNGQPGQVPPEDAFCYAVFLANGWNRSAKLTVSRAGQNLDVRAFARIPRGSGAQVQYEALPETGLPANEVAVLFLSRKLSLAATEQPGPYCPVAPAIEEDAAIWSTGRGLAFHITSDTPLSAYDIAPYRDLDAGAASATLLLPAPTWGTNYIAVAPNPVLDLESAVNPIPGRLWTTIVAMEDETTVRVSPSVPFPSAPSGTLPSVAPAAVGAVTEYKLQAGEAIQWQQAVADGMQQSPDPSGSVFESEKPFGLWTGNTRLTVPSATGPFQNRVDAEHEQLPPVHALGSEYVGAGIVTRSPNGEPESVPYRLMGVVDGTQLTWDPAPSQSWPSQLGQGQIVDIESSQLFSVRSQDAQHPFLFTQFMPTPPPSTNDCASLGRSRCSLGDAEWVSLVSTQQFLQHYVFFSDPSYDTTNLVVTRKKGPLGFQDVELECLGTLSGWRPVGSAGTFEVSHVDLVRAGVPIKDCGVSRHRAQSAGAFGVVVWGTDLAVSYAYPAGGNFGATNDVVVPVVR